MEDRLRYSRSAREIIDHFGRDCDKVVAIMRQRGIEVDALSNVETLETALDAERRRYMHANERRLSEYAVAAKPWADQWREMERTNEGLSLLEAHSVIIWRAEGVLPFSLPPGVSA